MDKKILSKRDTYTRFITPCHRSRQLVMHLNSADACTYFASSAKQTTNLASINITQLKNCAFLFPPLTKQSCIVTKVEKQQALAELKARLTAAQTKQAHLAETLIAEVV